MFVRHCDIIVSDINFISATTPPNTTCTTASYKLTISPVQTQAKA